MSKNILPVTESSVNSNSVVIKPKRISYNGAINGDAPAKTGVKAMIEKAGGKVVTAEAKEPTVQETNFIPGESIDDIVRSFKFQPMSLDDLLSMPPKEWLFDNCVGKGDFVVIYSDPASGKTFVAIDMIFAGCLGKPFAMRFEASKQMNIAYCAGEGVGGLPARFNAAAAHYGVKKMPNFTYYPVVPQLYESGSDDGMFGVETFIMEYKFRQDAGLAQPLDILIIDTMHSATVGADENSSKDMGHVLSMCKLATSTLGCAVVLIHHANRAGTGYRGSGSILGSADTMIKLQESSGKRSMSCEKLKDGEAWGEQNFSLVNSGDMGSVRVWWEETKDTPAEKSARVTLIDFFSKYPGKQFSLKSVAEATGLKDSNLKNLLPKLCDAGDIKRKLKDESKEQSSTNPWAYYI